MVVRGPGEALGFGGPDPALALVFDGREGQGYAAEAAVALRDWAHAALGLDRLVSYIDPRNTRPITLAERLGAVLDTHAAGQNPGDLVYRHRVRGGRPSVVKVVRRSGNHLP